MSVLFRSKENDEIASIYGEYYKPRDIKKITKGDKLDLLCDDGLNYHVDVKEVNHDANTTLLHFCKWSSKYDYKGSLDILYITKIGKFSEGITLQNNYVFMEKGSGSGDSPGSKVEVEKVARANFEKGKVYSFDYFEKPRVNNRRKADEVVDETIPAPATDKKRRAPPGLCKEEDLEETPVAAVEESAPSVADNKRKRINSSSSSANVKIQPSHALLNNLSSDISRVPVPVKRNDKAEASSNNSGSTDLAAVRLDAFGAVSREQVSEFITTYTTRDTPSRNAIKSVRSTLDTLTVSIGIDKSILNTRKVIDYVSNNEETLEKFLPATGAKQLISLLQARKNVDIVIAKILSNYIEHENDK